MDYTSTLDPAGIVNNAWYLNWFDQAMADALAAVDWPLERLNAEGWHLVQTAHQIDYLLPALAGTDLRIESQWVSMDSTRGAWRHRVYDQTTGYQLCDDYSVVACVDADGGAPRRLPDELASQLCAGTTEAGH